MIKKNPEKAQEKRSQIAPNGDASGGPDRNRTRTEKEASGSGQANAELSRGRPSQRGRAAGRRIGGARALPADLKTAGMAAAAEAGSSRRRIRRSRVRSRRRRRAGGDGGGVCGVWELISFFLFCALAGWRDRGGDEEKVVRQAQWW
jgi:hypothetical protein